MSVKALLGTFLNQVQPLRHMQPENSMSTETDRYKKMTREGEHERGKKTHGTQMGQGKRRQGNNTGHSDKRRTVGGSEPSPPQSPLAAWTDSRSECADPLMT